MDYNSLLRKKEFYRRHKNVLPDFVMQNYKQAFEIEYTHNSTAIEGNTLSLIETKVVLRHHRMKHTNRSKISILISHTKR